MENLPFNEYLSGKGSNILKLKPVSDTTILPEKPDSC
jgi:hypothetical protein